MSNAPLETGTIIEALRRSGYTPNYKKLKQVTAIDNLQTVIEGSFVEPFAIIKNRQLPADYDAAETYAAGDVVTYKADQFWVAIDTTTAGELPDMTPLEWRRMDSAYPGKPAFAGGKFPQHDEVAYVYNEAGMYIFKVGSPEHNILLQIVNVGTDSELADSDEDDITVTLTQSVDGVNYAPLSPAVSGTVAPQDNLIVNMQQNFPEGTFLKLVVEGDSAHYVNLLAV